MSRRRISGWRRLLRRTGFGLDAAAFVVALAAIAIVVSYFARRPEIRMRVDATKTRAYALSQQTRQLLDDLEGHWTIAVIMVEDAGDAAMRHQIDEVLRRYGESSAAVTVLRIDPTDPGTLAEYEALLTRLRELEADRIEAYEANLATGVDAFRQLLLFAQQQARQIETASAWIDPASEASNEAQQIVGQLSLLSEEGQKVLDAIADARRVTDTQPIPDYPTARSTLAQVLSVTADDLYEISRIMQGWSRQHELDERFARLAVTAGADFQEQAQQLAKAADPLLNLPPLEIGTIGRQLQTGEAAVVIGPERAAVIPSDHLLPTMNLREVGDGVVAFDRRFRGEQVISAAIRSLRIEQMPMVVFVHAEDQSLLRRNNQRADLMGVASLLQTSRYEVREWVVGQMDRPTPRAGQAVAWIVIPPMRRQGLEPDDRERSLLRGVHELIDEGQPLMLNLNPSRLPHYQLKDPWRELPAPLGIEPRTGWAIFEAVPVGEDEFQNQVGQVVQQFQSDHPIARAVHGQQTYFMLPVPLIVKGDDSSLGVQRTVIASVEPSPLRWLEKNWADHMRGSGGIERGEPFEQRLPIFIATERQNPEGPGRQRIIVAGSGAWLLSYVADNVTPIGGGRAALTNPGNPELVLASVAWLTQMDDLIAPSPLSQQVARLDGIDGTTSIIWALLTTLGLPIACFAVGAVIWFIRRT